MIDVERGTAMNELTFTCQFFVFRPLKPNTYLLRVVAPGEVWFEIYIPQIMPPLAP